jgi:hypothetical protein
LLVEAGDTAQDPIPVAVETARGLLISCLRATGRSVYSINPMAVARYRERHRVGRAKSDHADAMALANILRTDAEMHRALPADSELVQAIAVLARAQQDAVWNRGQLSNNGPHLVALVRAGTTFVHRKLAERPNDTPQPEAA